MLEKMMKNLDLCLTKAQRKSSDAPTPQFEFTEDPRNKKISHKHHIFIMYTLDII